MPKLVRKKTISEALDLQFSLNLTDVALKDALRAFDEALQIPIETGDEGLRAEGVTLDHPATLKIDNLKARDALKQFLEPLHLGFAVSQDGLIVTSARKAQRNTFTKTYYVADLVAPISWRQSRIPRR